MLISRSNPKLSVFIAESVKLSLIDYDIASNLFGLYGEILLFKLESIFIFNLLRILRIGRRRRP